MRKAYQEDAKVSDANCLNPAHDCQPNNGDSCVEDEKWAADLVLVTNPRARNHNNSSEDVRWRDETLCGTDFEAKSKDQNNGHEKGQGVGLSSHTEEDQSESPDLVSMLAMR